MKAVIANLPYRRCVASSSSIERIRLSLEVTGLASLFEGNVFSATQVAHGKPAPDLYLFAARTMSVTPSQCIVVEDSLVGVKAGVAAGMTVVGFAGGAHATSDLAQKLSAAGARQVLSSMSELPAVIAAFCLRQPAARLRKLTGQGGHHVGGAERREKPSRPRHVPRHRERERAKRQRRTRRGLWQSSR